MIVNKELKFALSVSVLLSIGYIYYDIPWGLMDDYKWIVRTEEFIVNPFSSYVEFQNYMIGKGTIQPFIHLQYIVQYIPGLYISPLLTHIENIFILIFTHYFLYKIIGNKIRINYLYSLSIFLIFPYTFDLFLLPSLQEKFTIPLFSYLLFKLEKAREEGLDGSTILFIISFSIPLIKLQGSVFILFVFVYFFYFRTKSSVISLLGFALSIFIQAYLLFFTNSGYYVLEKTPTQILNNLLSLQNLLFIVVILLSGFFAFIDNNKETKIYINGFCLSGLGIIFILINWDSYGYLYGFYTFFLCILIPYCIVSVSERLNFKPLNNLIPPVLIVLTLLSANLFFLPRIERWSDLNLVYDVLDSVKLDNNIYYCGSEGVLTFNNLNDTKNKVSFAGNFNDIRQNVFYFISDDLQCDYLNDDFLSNCEISYPFNSKYKRMEINKYSCNK